MDILQFSTEKKVQTRLTNETPIGFRISKPNGILLIETPHRKVALSVTGLALFNPYIWN